ncbi:MAG: hypothetical protein H7070_15085 [Saprospiraceae bacterium]|nr:hypothetical protein [Pyrinomonadaceae bacterium]
MNSDKSIDSLCLHSGELVSYLYDEMPAAGQTVFEGHLADCSVCTDEFAELSLARLGVYEWQRDEFAAMPTPFIAIPYEDAPVRVSWMESWLGPIFSAPKWATAGGALAAVAISLGLVLFASTYMGGRIEVADVQVIEQTESLDRSTGTKDKQIVEVITPNLLNDQVVKPKYAQEPGRLARPVQASVQKPSPRKNKVSDQVTASKTVRDKNKVPVRTAPRLNNFEDEDDNTLRLADLFADVDTRK